MGQGRRKDTPVPNTMSTHRNEGTLGVFAATLSSGYALVLTEHKSRLAEAAFYAGRGAFAAGDLTAVIRVGAGWDAGGKAVGVLAVGWAFQSYVVQGYEINAQGLGEPTQAGDKETRLGGTTRLFSQQTLSEHKLCAKS